MNETALCAKIVKYVAWTIERCIMGEYVTEKWIGIDEAADYLGIRPVTLREWIRKGKDVPAHKIGKQWKFKCSELDNWVKSGQSAE